MRLVRGGSRLAVAATHGVTDLVEDVHVTIASGPAVLGSPFARPARALTRGVYGTIRSVTRLVGVGIEAALDQLPAGPDVADEALVAALNGVVGDYLERTNNPLAITAALRAGGRPLVLERAALNARFPAFTGRLLVLVHGSCSYDLHWQRAGHDHGAAMSEHGYTPIYLNYNSGLHVSTNGRALADLLEALVAAWPEVAEISLLAHSMGGLVARSACHVAEDDGQVWRTKLKKLVCLGTPHHGSALERGGNLIDRLLGVSRYSAPFARLGQIRSAGVTDLRYGNVLDEHWRGRDRFAPHDARRALALPEGVACYAMAGTTATTMSDDLPGDRLVPVDSALGRHPRPALTLPFPPENTWIALGTGHLELLDRGVFPKVCEWLTAR